MTYKLIAKEPAQAMIESSVFDCWKEPLGYDLRRRIWYALWETAPQVDVRSDERIAQAFHAEYERLAPSFGYETRPDSRKPWEDVPEQNRKLMIAVVGNVRALLAASPQPDMLTMIVARLDKKVADEFAAGRPEAAGYYDDAANIALAVGEQVAQPAQDPLQVLTDQAQELDMGYGPNACRTCGKSQPAQEEQSKRTGQDDCEKP